MTALRTSNEQWILKRRRDDQSARAGYVNPWRQGRTYVSAARSGQRPDCRPTNDGFDLLHSPSDLALLIGLLRFRSPVQNHGHGMGRAGVVVGVDEKALAVAADREDDHLGGRNPLAWIRLEKHGRRARLKFGFRVDG